MTNAEVMVLMSGGVDSSACLDFYREFGRPVSGLFVDYGQPAAISERDAAERIAAHYGVALQSCAFSGTRTRAAGLLPGRNLLLLAAGLFDKPDSVTAIAIGVHAGTEYDDCSPAFIESARRAFALAGCSACDVAAPFLEWSKVEIYEYAKRRNVPLHLTYSCEAANVPCGACLSCGDRRHL